MNKQNRKRQTRPHNRRFREHEASIFIAILKRFRFQRRRITVRQIVNDSGISRQTFYTHHHGMNKAIEESEAALLKDYMAHLRKAKTDEKDSETINRKVFTSCFIFISQHKDVFRQICSDMASQGIIYEMLKLSYPMLQVAWLPVGKPTPTIDSESVDRYIRMATGIVCSWVQSKEFDLRNADRYIKQLLHLTTHISRYSIMPA